MKPNHYAISISNIVRFRKLYWRIFVRWLTSRPYRRMKKSYSYWANWSSINYTTYTHLRESDRNPIQSFFRNSKYIWASIIREENYGNYLIEYCLKNILMLPPPDLEIDVLRRKFPEDNGEYGFIVNPGTTTLYQCPTVDLAYRNMHEVSIPTVCFGGSIWFRDYWKKMITEDELINVSRSFGYKVGCRDPFTYDILQNNSVDSAFIGCPTLFCQSDAISNGYIAFSFGRERVIEQVQFVKKLAKRYDVKIVIHEPREIEWCCDLGAVVINGVDNILDTYYHSECVITGRLHGALPGMSAQKPVIYFQCAPDFDSRLTLLSYLGLPLNSLDNMEDLDYSEITYDVNKIDQLKSAFLNYVKEFRRHIEL